jgi:cytochrome c-type biogenesis protein CcmH/NrfG
MQGINLVREVVNRDSTNIYAQMVLVRGSLISGQYDKAVSRLQTVISLKPGYLEAMVLLAEVYERTGDTKNAIAWYEKSILLVDQPRIQAAIRERIAALKK